MDEHQNSINDSHFLPFRNLREYGHQPWLDMPTGRHRNAAGIAYADGHTEIYRWVDSDVHLVSWPPSFPAIYAPFPRPGPRDFAWFTNHLAAFK